MKTENKLNCVYYVISKFTESKIWRLSFKPSQVMYTHNRPKRITLSVLTHIIYTFKQTLLDTNFHVY